MSARFEELAHAPTRMGELSLRRRLEPLTGTQVYEVKLDQDYLMSSMFTVAEEALADLALERAAPGTEVGVLVGGLGLGYTAVAALRHPQVGAVHVVEALRPVIDWHEQGLLPRSAELVRDARTLLVEGDFFALVDGTGDLPGLRRDYDVVLLDVDHAPDFVLDPSHQDFYTASGLRGLRRVLRPGGVFALWSDRDPHGPFLTALQEVFPQVRAEEIRFANPLTRGTSTATVYLAGGDGDGTEPATRAAAVTDPGGSPAPAAHRPGPAGTAGARWRPS